MKSTFNILLLLSLGFLSMLTFSCEENEPEISGIEPWFNVKFINQDSLEELDFRISIVNALIEDVKDSINRIEQRVAEGDNTDYTGKLDTLNIQRDSLTADKTFFREVISVINSGKVKVSKLSAENGAADILYQDSSTLYRFPLNTHADLSRFYITIDEEVDTLAVNYQRNTSVSERKVYIETTQFKVIESTFNDLKIKHSDSTNFSSNEATVTIYF